MGENAGRLGGTDVVTQLAVLPNPAGAVNDPSGMSTAISRMLALGVDAMPVGTAWPAAEQHMPPAEEWTARALGLGPYTALHSPITMHTRNVPADLTVTPMDDEGFVARFKTFLEASLERAVTARSDYRFGIGNEINTYLKLHPNEREAFMGLLRLSRSLVDDHFPEVRLGTTIAFQPPFEADDLMAELADVLDWVGMQWYAFGDNPIGAMNYVEGRNDCRGAFDQMHDAAHGMAVLATEIGMPSSEVLGGSEELQAAFVTEMIGELRRRDDIEIVCWFYLHDLSQEITDHLVSAGVFSDLPGGLSGSKRFAEYIRTAGLLNADGSEKLAAGAWKAARAAAS